MKSMRAVIRPWQRMRQREFLCRWLLVGRLAFAQLGDERAADEPPSVAWVQMLPETPAGWHPLEQVGHARVLTLDHRVDGLNGDWPGRCPN